MKFQFWRHELRQRQLDQELQSHLDMAVRERVERGVSPEQAQHDAAREFGNVTLVRQVTYDQWGWRLGKELYEDVRFGLRMLGKSPGFACIVVLTLALGIGANSAIFSLIDAALLRALPVRDAEQLVLVEWHAHNQPSHWSSSSYGDCKDEGRQTAGCSMSQPFFNEIRRQPRIFSSVAAFAGADGLDLTSDGSADTINEAEYVSGDYFQTLGVEPAVGRLIGSEDDTPAAPVVAVLSYAYWQGKFGASPSVIGKTVLLNKVPCTIIGVAERRFDAVSPGKYTQAWIPLIAERQLEQPWDNRDVDERNWWLVVVGRLNPGTNRKQAQAAIGTIFAREVTGGARPTFKPEDYPAISLIPIEQGLAGNRGEISTPLFVLLLAVGIVLLIACANVAGLLLSRASARQQEMAVRFALGASRARILRQLLTESVLLSMAGGALGILFASWCVHSIMAFAASVENGSPPFHPGIDLRVMAFTAAISILTALLFGLAPALRGVRVDLSPMLKKSLGQSSPDRGRRTSWCTAGNALVVIQVALSIVVLAGAGLLVRTLQNLKSVDPGFDTRNLLTFSLEPALIGYKPAETSSLSRELQARFAATPGIMSASYSWRPLLGGGLWTTDFHLPDRPKNETVDADMLPVGAEFFKTMGIPLLAGREFDVADLNRAQAASDALADQREEMVARLKAGVSATTKSAGGPSVAAVPAIVNEAFLRSYLPHINPLGQKFGAADGNVDTQEPRNPGWEVVGVAGDAKYNNLRRDVHPTIYVPHSGGTVSFALRTAGGFRISPLQIRSIVGQIDKNLPVYSIKTEKEHIDRQIFKERLIARLSGFFGALALLLACVGLYGLVSYEVARRTREIGIRTALGADTRDVLRLVLTQGMRLVLLGALLGIALALGLMRFAANLLYGVRAADPATFAAVTALLAGVTLAACYVPARRAARVDPVVALRYE